MPDISQIKTPDGTTYNLKDSRLDPILDETYSGYYATANTDAQKYFFFLKVVRSNYNTLWRVKMKVEFTVPSHPEYAYTLWDADIVGFQSAIKAYYIKTNHGQNRACRYFASAFPKTTTANEIYLGGNIYADLSYNSSDYARTIHVTVTETYNCEVVALDNFFKLADGIVTTTNFTLATTDLNSVGLQETGDANTTYSIFNSIGHGNGSFVADSAIYRYQLLFHTTEDKLTPLNNVDNGYNSTSKAILTNVEFDPFSEIFYYISTTNYAANAAVPAANLATEYGSVDLRYSLNISASVNALTAHKDVYMKVIPQSNGKVKLAAAFPLVQALPVLNDGYWYIYLGRAYSTYQMALYPHHEVYYHNGTAVVQKLPPNTNAGLVNGHTVNSDVPSGAKFTDTTYSAGTGLSLSGTTFNHSSSITAGTAGTSSATSGSTLAVPYVTYNAQGHITAAGTHTHTISGFLTSHQTIKQDGITGAVINRYGVCSTASDTAAKEVSISDGTFSLEDGARVSVMFAYPNAATNPTLNVNGTGTMNIYFAPNLSSTSGGTYIFENGQQNLLSGLCDFIYDSEYGWVLVSSGETMRNEVVYSTTTPSTDIRGTLWVKPASATVEELKCLVVASGAISSLPTTISDSRIASDMVVINQTVSNPAAQVGNWTWSTTDGSITLSGSISGSTYVTFYLLKSR